MLPVYAGILINEISAGGKSDWVELKATDDISAADISSLFVTMYYGTNEKIAGETVTLRGKNIPETPYDDRFAVIHFSSSGERDETDAAGDINNNGVRDLYCCNNSLWNTDCVTAIDTDDEPENGGIIDFVAFSGRDGTPNSIISGYMKSASDSGEWLQCNSSNTQECMVFTGEKGMNSYSTLSRKSSGDTNTPEDFTVTPYATPGKENIIKKESKKNKIAKPLSEKITYKPGRSQGCIPFHLFIYRQCSVKIKIFNAAGTGIFSSKLIKDINPGYFTLKIKETDLRGKILTGLFPVFIEAYADGKTDKSVVYLVMIRR